jgi:hypothetical protein
MTNGENLKTCFNEHRRYIRTNNPRSAYGKYIFENKHEYGPVRTTRKLMKPCSKGKIMNCWENLYIQQTFHKGQLIPEQTLQEHNISTTW